MLEGGRAWEEAIEGGKGRIRRGRGEEKGSGGWKGMRKWGRRGKGEELRRERL